MMTHGPDCKRAAIILERRRIPETGKTEFREVCKGCGAIEEVNEEEALKNSHEGGYFIPTR
jgi:hypothetical protein